MGVASSCSCKSPNEKGFEDEAEISSTNCVKRLCSMRRNLVFPNETLEKILSFLSTRDKLVAREVCMDWCLHINSAGNLQETVKVKVTSDELGRLAVTFPVFTAFYFHKLDITRQSLNFWSAYSDIITHLEFYDCSIIPRNTSDSKQPTFSLGCPNLKHLSLVNCDKYFLMGGTFIQLHEILCLENLEVLNLSQNKNLSDSILFSILLKTKRLQKLDLSDCVNMVFMKAVHNRFYPAGKPCPPYSDHVLSFHTLCKEFLQTSRGNVMTSFNFGMRFNSTGMSLILANESVNWKYVNLESPELKLLDVVQFISKFNKTLLKIELGRCKISAQDLFHANLFSLLDFSIYDSRNLASLEFLSTLPNLQRLVLDGTSDFEINSECFQHVPNLKELSLNGIKPNQSPEVCRSELIVIFKMLSKLAALDIGNCPQIVNDHVLQTIIQYLKGLRRLNIEASSISDIGMGALRNFDGEVSNNDVTTLSLSQLSEIKYLNMSHCRVNELTWLVTDKIMNLAVLNLSNCNTLSRRGILSIIDNCRNLELLTLIHCPGQILTDPEVVTAAREKLYRCKGIVY